MNRLERMRLWLGRRWQQGKAGQGDVVAATTAHTSPWPGVRSGAVALFLDFDGVLHPGTSETFELLPELYRILDAVPEVDVVIASRWRIWASKAYLLALFAPAYQHRIRDVTGAELVEGRQAEIEAYARSRGIRRLVAVDDDVDGFRADCPWVVVVPRLKGLGLGNADRVIAALRAAAATP